MAQGYHRWPFLPAHMRTPEQDEQWWNHCFTLTLLGENFANAVGSTAVISTPGNGGTTALEQMVRHLGNRSLIVRYAPQNWPHGTRPKMPGKEHISQIMSLVATEVAHRLETEPGLFTAVAPNPLQQEFLCWLLEKHLGRRTLVRRAYRLQQSTGHPFAIPEQFNDMYPTDTLAADVWGQIGEAAELSQALGFAQIILLVDVNAYEMQVLLDDLSSLLARLDLLEHPGWSVRAALPQSDTVNKLLEGCGGRLHPIRLAYSEQQMASIVAQYVQVSTDGRWGSLEGWVDTAVRQRAAQEIQTLYGAPSLRGWLDWAETLLHLEEAGSEFKDAELSEADKASLTYYKRHVLLRLDEKKRGLWRGPQFISLENQPYDLMKKLFELRGQPAPEALYDIAGSVANLNTIVNRLRLRIEPVKGKTNIYLQNRRDQGYWLENFVF